MQRHGSLRLVLLKVFVCLAAVGIALYCTIRAQNSVTRLRRQIPPLAKELKGLQEENQRLQYDIDHFENPVHLLELTRKPEYSHLKFPYNKDVIRIEDSTLKEEF